LWLAGVNILSWPSYDQTTIRVGLDPGLYPLEVWGRQRGERGVSVRLSGPGLGETPVELEPAWIRCEPIAERVLEK